MQTFTDLKGRTWVLEITSWEVRQARLRLGLVVDDLITDRCKPLIDLLSDPIRLIDFAFLLCERQAHERGITDEDFGRAINGDLYEVLAEAVYEALNDFFPKATRELLRALGRKAKAVQALKVQQMETLTRAIEQTSAEEVLAKSSEPAGESPAN